MKDTDTSVFSQAMVLLHDMINRSLDRRGAQWHFTRNQIMIINRIADCPGMSQTELAGMLSASKQYISQTVSVLEERGLVEGKVPFSDSRVKRLYLAEEGEKLNAEWRAQGYQIMMETLSHLTQEEQERLYESFVTQRELLPKLVAEGKTLF